MLRGATRLGFLMSVVGIHNRSEKSPITTKEVEEVMMKKSYVKCWLLANTLLPVSFNIQRMQFYKHKTCENI
jgi:hypothetical protein